VPLAQTHQVEIAVGLLLDGREITSLHFRILSHPFSHSVWGDYQTVTARVEGNHNSRCGAGRKVFSFSSFHHSNLFA
jgi:hypothetical protein